MSQGPTKLQTQSDLISTGDLIKRAQDLGVDFGNGSPQIRLRYFVKLGLIATPQRIAHKGTAAHKLPPSIIGYYPYETLEKLADIDKLKKQGFSFEKIKKEFTKDKGLKFFKLSKTPKEVLTASIEKNTQNLASTIRAEVQNTFSEKNLNSIVDSRIKFHNQNLKLFEESLNTPSAYSPKINRYFIMAIISLPLLGLVSISLYSAKNYVNQYLVNQNSKGNSASANLLGQVLAATSDEHRLYIDADTEVSGLTTFVEDITAPNVLYSLLGGTGITVSTGQNPTVAVDTTAIVPSVNSLAGALTISGSGGTTISTSGSTITITTTSSPLTSEADTLSTVTGRGATTSTALTLNGAVTLGSTLSFSTTNSSVNITNTGSLAFKDGTNTLFSIIDQGSYGTLRLTDKGSTSDPSSCSAGDIYFNATDTTVKACTATNTWEALDGGGSMTSFTLSGDTGTDQTISDTNTLEVAGGTNGIDTVGTDTDTITLNLNLTEVGAATFGTNAAATSYLWTWDLSSGTDPTITFGDNAITLLGNLNAATGLDVDDVFVVADGGAVTANTDVDFTLASTEDFTITNTTWAPASAIGLVDINVTSSTSDARGIDLAYTFSGTATSNVAYGLYNALSSSQVLATTVSQTFFGQYNNITKTGADTTSGTIATYGIYTAASNTGSTDAGTKNTYGGYFSAAGDNPGSTNVSNTYGIFTSTTSAVDTNYALYTTASGATTNYGIYSAANVAFDGDLTFVGAQTVSTTSGTLTVTATSANLALSTTTSGDITATTAAGTGLFNVLTGNLKVGSGSPSVSLNGQDAYITGTFEVDGTSQFDAQITVNQTIYTNTGFSATIDSTSGPLLDLEVTNLNGLSAYNSFLYSTTISDASTVYGLYNAVVAGNALGAGTTYGEYIRFTSSAPFSNTQFGSGIDYANSASISSGTKTSYGNYLSVSSTGATGGTTLAYGVYSTTTATHASNGGTNSAFAGYFSATGTDAGASNTSTTYGIYATATGGDTNYAAYFNGNISIGSNIYSSNSVTIDLVNASGDTVLLLKNSDSTYNALLDVERHIAVGNAASANNYTLGNFESTDVGQIGGFTNGIVANTTVTDQTTAGLLNIRSIIATPASAMTLAAAYGFYADNPTVGATSAITNNYGVYVANQTSATNNYGIYASAVNGAGDYAAYFDTGVTYINLNTTATTNVICHTANNVNSATDAEYGLVACSSDAVDYAEQFATAQDVEYGDVVVTGNRTVNPNPGVNRPMAETELVKSQVAYDDHIIGVASDNYSDLTSTGTNRFAQEDHPIPIALSGRVPVKVTDEGGPINVGDLLTTSSTPGHAMKADPKMGSTFGKALTSFTGPGSGEVVVFMEVNTRYNLAQALGNMDLEANTLIASSIRLTNNIQINQGSINEDGTLNEEIRDQVLTADQVRQLVQIEVERQISALNSSTQNSSLITHNSIDNPLPGDSSESTDSASPEASNSSDLAQQTQNTLDELAQLLSTTDLSLSTLTVTGQSNLAATYVAGTFAQDGTLIIDYGRQINVLGSTLYLQNDPFAGSPGSTPIGVEPVLVDIGAGKVQIDKDGNLIIKGSLKAESVQTDNIFINVNGNDSSLVGNAILQKGKTNLTVASSKVLPGATILITPTSPTNGKSLYIDQVNDFEGFKVAVDGLPSSADIKFNWLIINTKQISQN